MAKKYLYGEIEKLSPMDVKTLLVMEKKCTLTNMENILELKLIKREKEEKQRNKSLKKWMNMEHAIKRNQFKWKAAGKFHDGSLRTVTLAEMSDSHLLHVIGWVMNHSDSYPCDVLNTLLEEAKFRSENYLFVKDYTD